MNRISLVAPWLLLVAVVAIAANSYPDHCNVMGVDRSIKGFVVNATDSGDNTLVSVPAGNLLKLLSLGVRSYGDTSVQWYLKTDTDGGIWGSASAPFVADQTGVAGPAGEYMPFSSVGEISTSTAGDDLEVSLSAAVPLWLKGTYVLVPE